MKDITTKRLLKLIDFHEEQDKKLPRKLSLELGDEHSELLQRLAILFGQTKTQVIRVLIEKWFQNAHGGLLIIDDPSQLLHAHETAQI